MLTSSRTTSHGDDPASTRVTILSASIDASTLTPLPSKKRETIAINEASSSTTNSLTNPLAPGSTAEITVSGIDLILQVCGPVAGGYEWGAGRAPIVSASAEPTGDVVLGSLVGWIREHLGRRIILDEHARPLIGSSVEPGGEERGAIADARGLLHVVRDDHDREPRLQRPHQLLDPRGRDRVERAARLVHQHDLR